jgi:hypothetical protein
MGRAVVDRDVLLAREPVRLMAVGPVDVSGVSAELGQGIFFCAAMTICRLLGRQSESSRPDGMRVVIRLPPPEVSPAPDSPVVVGFS